MYLVRLHKVGWGGGRGGKGVCTKLFVFICLFSRLLEQNTRVSFSYDEAHRQLIERKMLCYNFVHLVCI